jgi:hypothetical protein
VVQEPFTDTPGARVTNRVRSMSKVLGNITREETIVPPLVQQTSGSLVRWNRFPRRRVDVVAWRRRVVLEEQYSVAPQRLRNQMATVDADLALWLRQHPHLQAAEPDAGESGMALLLLWEIDHGAPFPSAGSADRSVALMGFTKRLLRRVQADPELRGWLHTKDMHAPLAPGLTPSHHLRWGVRIRPPGPDEPHGWYTDFVQRWHAYIVDLLPGDPAPSQPAPQPQLDPAAASSSSARWPATATAPAPAPPAIHRRPRTAPADTEAPPPKRRRGRAAGPGPPPAAAPMPPAAQPAPPARGRLPKTAPAALAASASAVSRPRDLRSWLTAAAPAGTEDSTAASPPSPAPGHGRAVQGPPT